VCDGIILVSTPFSRASDKSPDQVGGIDQIAQFQQIAGHWSLKLA
jgi:hypothetical protein